MPKQTISYPPNESVGILPEVALHWTSNKDLGQEPQISFAFDVDEMLTYLKKLQKDSPTDRRASFYTDGLRRADLQILIKTARTARDAAYGSDE